MTVVQNVNTTGAAVLFRLLWGLNCGQKGTHERDRAGFLETGNFDAGLPEQGAY